MWGNLEYLPTCNTSEKIIFKVTSTQSYLLKNVGTSRASHSQVQGEEKFFQNHPRTLLGLYTLYYKNKILNPFFFEKFTKNIRKCISYPTYSTYNTYPG